MRVSTFPSNAWILSRVTASWKAHILRSTNWAAPFGTLARPACANPSKIWLTSFSTDLRTRVLQAFQTVPRSEEHTSELQSRGHLVCRLLLEKKKVGTATKTAT